MAVLEILQATKRGDVSHVVAKFDRVDQSGPLAPAGIYTHPASGREVFQLHKAVAEEGDTVTFETYGSQQPLPKVGARFFYRGWWVQDAMDAALDPDANWVRRAYPNDGDHDHCLFTWETISARGDQKEGYWSEKYGWITVKAYEDFIAGDIYRLRSAPTGA